MILKGTLKSIVPSFDGGIDILINLDVKRVSESIEKLLNEVVSIRLAKYRKPRSLDANAYYWELVGQVAEALKESTPYRHNQYLRKCGYIDHNLYEKKGAYTVTTYLPENDETQKEIDEDMHNHFLPTNQLIVDKNGQVLRGYILLKGSHCFDSKQFSRLINFVVEDCHELGIETLPPYEVERICKAVKN